MGVRALALALIVLALAGCARPAEPTTAPPVATPTAGTQATAPAIGETPHRLDGFALTYRTSGIYNTGRDETLVIVPNGSGYLFAGATKDDIMEAAVWGRDWSGPHDAQLEATAPGSLRLFDFPLTEGKTWALTKDVTVVAHASPRGFVMTSADGKRTLRYEYDAGVGYLASYHSSGDKPYEAIDLVKAARAASYAWFAAGPSADASSSATPPAPVTLAMPDGYDAVVLSPGGTGGSVVVQPPGGAAPFTWSATAGKETWTYASLPAASGTWTLAAVPSADGYSYVRAVAVKWTSGSIGSR